MEVPSPPMQNSPMNEQLVAEGRPVTVDEANWTPPSPHPPFLFAPTLPSLKRA